MKTATVREVQHHLREVLEWVIAGEEVQVLRRNKVVARLLPPGPEAVSTPDFVARAKAVWGNRPRGAALSRQISDARGDR